MYWSETATANLITPFNVQAKKIRAVLALLVIQTVAQAVGDRAAVAHPVFLATVEEVAAGAVAVEAIAAGEVVAAVDVAAVAGEVKAKRRK